MKKKYVFILLILPVMLVVTAMALAFVSGFGMATKVTASPLLIIPFFAVCILLTLFWSSTARKIAGQDTSFRILLALITTQLFTVLIVAWQNCERYALPVLCLSGLLLFLIFVYFQRRNDLSRFDNKKGTIVMVAFLALRSVWRFIGMNNLFRDYRPVKQESLTVFRQADNEYKNYLKVTSSPAAALSHGNYYTSHKYLSISEMETRLFYSESLQNNYGEAYFQKQ
ncbi:MAG: hypothetical protein WC373_02390 [Smithella sp.]|jgi:hypothetical protein